VYDIDIYSIIALASAIKERQMSLPLSFYSETYNDNTLNPKTKQPEFSTWEVPITTLTAANYTAQKVLIDELSNAVADLVIGVLAKATVIFERQLVSADRASSKLAQRENKWLMRYTDNTSHQKFRVSVGTADLTQLPDDGSEFLDITTVDSLGNNLKIAFEAIVKSPDDASHAVTLQSVQFVGRNT